MYLERLELTDFRSYPRVELTFEPGPQVLVGPNAQGKTNLLEAVHYLAVGASHRVSSDAPLVRSGADSAVIRAVARLDEAGARTLRVDLELRPHGRNRAQVDGQTQSRQADALGLVRSVLFAPEDLQLVRGDPAERRRFLDDLLAQRRAAYRAARQEYDRVLRQRNALLRQRRPEWRSGPADGGDPTLETWTAALVATGSSLLAARIAAVHALAGPAGEAYADLVAASPQRTAQARLGLSYQLSTGRSIAGDPGGGVPDPAALAAELAEGLAARAGAERERGMTLAGPHRDDLVLTLGDLPARGYASHGESWSLALALRIASRDVLHDVGEEPVVLLDDVFAELDTDRRERLAARCGEFRQVLVTAAVDADVPLGGPRYKVRAGEVSPAAPGQGDER